MLLAAFFYAVTIIATARFAGERDPIIIGFLQVAVMGILASIAAFIFENPSMPTSSGVWGSLIYLAIVCTCFGFTLQPLAQSKCLAEKAAIFCALNPMVAVILGVVLMDETFDKGDMIGLILVFLSIIIYGKEDSNPKLKN